MRKIISVSVIVFLVVVNSYGQSEKCNIEGIWLTNNKKLKLEFYASDNSYEARVVWKAEDADSDIKVGDILIKDLKYNNSENTYEEGILLAKGKKLDCKIECANSTKIEILVSMGFIKKELVWSRIKK